MPAGRAKLAGLLFGGSSTQASRPSRTRAAPKQVALPSCVIVWVGQELSR